MPQDVVLVHGLWHAPEHFDLLRQLLEESGIWVHAPELHRGSLAADVAAVQHTVDACPSPPVLVGHSYGGAVLGHTTGSSAMLFVAAFVLEVGESASEMSSPPAIAPAITFRDDGRSVIDPDLATAYLYADCDADLARDAVTRLRPQDPGHGRAPATAATWRSAPTRYVVCSQDRALHPAIQRRMASRCSSRTELAAGHSPFLSQPQAIADEVHRLLRCL